VDRPRRHRVPGRKKVELRSNIGVDWEGLKDEEDNSHVSAEFDMGINDFTVFARVRF